MDSERCDVSQKMGKSRAEYMRDYRQKKREERLKTENVEPKKVARNSTQRSRDFRARAANLILSQTSTADPTRALTNLVVSHATLRLPSLPFSPTPTTSTATAYNSGNAESRQTYAAGHGPLPSTATSTGSVLAASGGFLLQQYGLDHDNSNVENMPGAASQYVKDSSQSENEIKVFCPNCDTEVSHIAAGIQANQTKILIAKVYHYLEHEYEELKIIYGDLDLTPLLKFRERTALATGVSETTVLQILKEEEERNADKRQEPPEERRRARKRCRQTDSSSDEDSSDDYADVHKQSSDVHEAQTLVVKVEPPEYYNEEPEIFIPAAVKVEPSDVELNNEEPEIFIPAAVKVEPSDVELNKEQAVADPISVDVKTEPRSDVVDNANETFALNEPAGTKRKARKIPRSDVTATRSGLLGESEVKVEDIDIGEEGFS